MRGPTFSERQTHQGFNLVIFCEQLRRCSVCNKTLFGLAKYPVVDCCVADYPLQVMI
jgi:hypothetical protein